MQLSQLEYLQAVANYGGVRKAARAVHVSPQAVSSAIKKLESEYQIVLLDRSAGEAVLSPAGREFARRARVILAQVDDLKKYAQSGNGGVSPDGHFRLYAPARDELPPISRVQEMGGSSSRAGAPFFRKLVRLV